MAEVRLKWNSSLELQRIADAAYATLRDKSKRKHKSVKRKKKKRRARKPQAKTCGKLHGYEKYLTSNHWVEFRTKVFMIRGRKCELCGSTKYVHVHHLTYARIGNERMNDVQVLCRNCHVVEHEIKAEPDGMTREFLWIIRGY